MRYSIWFKSINYFQFFVSCVQNLFCVCVFICTKHIPSEPRTWRQEVHRGGPLVRTCRWAMLQKNTFSLTSFKWTGDGCNTLNCECARGKRFCTTTWLYCEPGSAWSSTSPPSWSCPTSFCWRGPEIITFMKLNEKYTYMDGSRRLGPRRSGPRLAIGAPPPWP